MDENGKFIRDLENGWCEFLSAQNNRKYYFNKGTKECSWKPPRKEEHFQKTALAKDDGDNVGGLLQMGKLYIAKLPLENKKNKWMKSSVFLSNTHFGYKCKKKSEKPFEKISLFNATITKDNFKKNKYCLASLKSNILFKGNDPITVEAWFHAIETVIENLQKTKNKILNLNGSFFTQSELNIFQFNTELFRTELGSPGKPLSKSNSLKTSFRSNVLKDCPDTLPDRIRNDEAIDFKLPCPPYWDVRFDLREKQYWYENRVTQDSYVAKRNEGGQIYFENLTTHDKFWLLPSLHGRWSVKETVI